MPLTVSNPRDLYLVALADILFVERLLDFEVLPDLLGQVRDAELAKALAEHREQTRGHAERVERAFRLVGAEPSSARSAPFVGSKEQHEEVAGGIKDERLADLFHAMAAVHTEHYEIAAYRALIALARALEQREAVELLEANLAEEEAALERAEAAVARLSSA
jgi:ferritin-like metal-binding protein YciE